MSRFATIHYPKRLKSLIPLPFLSVSGTKGRAFESRIAHAKELKGLG